MCRYPNCLWELQTPTDAKTLSKIRKYNYDFSFYYFLIIMKSIRINPSQDFSPKELLLHDVVTDYPIKKLH